MWELSSCLPGSVLGVPTVTAVLERAGGQLEALAETARLGPGTPGASCPRSLSRLPRLAFTEGVGMSLTWFPPCPCSPELLDGLQTVRLK